MLFNSRSYAVGQAHFQIAGGWNSLGLLSAAYVALTTTILGIIFYYAETPIPPSTYTEMYTWVTVIEAFILVVFGSIRVAACVRTDINTNMIESHRLMPVSSWRAMLGYLFGANAHVLAVTLLNITLLLVVKSWLPLSISDLLVSQLVLGIFALFCWTFTAMGASMPRQLRPLIVVGFIAGSIASMALRDLGLVPGLTMLSSPFLGATVFNPEGAGAFAFKAYPVALSANLAFAALFFLGAARRYRGTHASTFNLWQGLALGAVWAALSIPSIIHWSQFNPMRMLMRRPPPHIEMALQVVAGITIAALLAIIPMHALAVLQKRRKMSTIVAASVVIGTVLIAASNMLAFQPNLVPPPPPAFPAIPGMPFPLPPPPMEMSPPPHVPMLALIWVTALILTLHVFTMYQSFRATRNLSPMSTGVFICGLLFIVWVLPFLLELGRFVLTPVALRSDSQFSVLGSLSPLGLLLSQWLMDEPVLPVAGLVFQGAVAAGVWILAERMNKKSLVSREAVAPL